MEEEDRSFWQLVAFSKQPFWAQDKVSPSPNSYLTRSIRTWIWCNKDQTIADTTPDIRSWKKCQWQTMDLFLAGAIFWKTHMWSTAILRKCLAFWVRGSNLYPRSGSTKYYACCSNTMNSKCCRDSWILLKENLKNDNSSQSLWMHNAWRDLPTAYFALCIISQKV